MLKIDADTHDLLNHSKILARDQLFSIAGVILPSAIRIGHYHLENI
jgi:hypothetical protein